MKFHYFQIEKYIKGNCGTVQLGFYVKRNCGLTSILAIKEIPVKASPELIVSLLQEINVLRKTNHLNILGFIDAKKKEEFMYLVQNTVIKELWMILSCIISSRKKMWLCSLDQQLQHSKIQLAKRLFIETQNPKSYCYIIDKLKLQIFDQLNRKFQIFSGTSVFMSPLIIKQESFNSLSDMWSLGVTFYFMLFREYKCEKVKPLKLQKKKFKKTLTMSFLKGVQYKMSW
ncbi:unnamed protein product [Paramecium octaurelia]|uniref:Protein kinase domain-containing protein n=1 Tax=Paramecium octaurelia TaxID=43137 RepID=A0A8S1S852_PAROT|nr:unnamed protein product [Paramecium octaurelia]